MVLGRGNQTATALIWNESNTQFATIYTTESFVGATTGTINNSGYANFRTGNAFVTTITSLNGGQLSGYLTGPIGANTANTGVFTSVTTTSGGQLTGYLTGPIGANTANSGVFTSVTTTSGGQLTGYVTGPVGANTANSGVFTSVTTVSGGQLSGYLTGAIGANTANSGVFTSVTTVSGGQLSGYVTGPVGANTANTGAFTTLTSSGLTTFTDATQASAYNTASVVLSGGLGVTKDAWVHGNFTVDGNLLVSGSRTIIGATTFSVLDPIIDLHTYANLAALTSNDNADIGLKLHYYDTLDTAAFLGRDNATGYLVWEDKGSDVANVFTPTSMGTFKAGEIWLANTTASASTVTGVLRLDGGAGIRGNLNVGGGISGVIGNANAAAGTFTSVTTVSGGQLTGYHTGVIGANTANTGAFTTLTTTSTIISNGNIVANSSTAATNSTTGALVVVGGAGVSGNIYSGSWVNGTTGIAGPTHGADTITPYSTANININPLANDGNVVINSNGYRANLIVQGNTALGYQNLLVTNGGTGQVGIKIAPNAIQSGASFQINATDSFILPVGSTGQRPTVGQVTKGMQRFNNTSNLIEFWDGTQWNSGAAVFTVISADSFTGNGSQVNFTLSQSGTTASVMVAINGVIQIPTTAYTVSGTTLTFTEAPLSTDIIDARTLVTTVVQTSIADGTTSIQLSNTAPSITAAVQGSNVWVANTSTYFNGGISSFNANTSLTQNTLTTIDTFAIAKFRSAKYVVTVSDFAGSKYQTAEVLVVHNGTTATSTIFGVTSTSGSNFVTYSASVSGSNVILQANSTSAASYGSVQQIYNAV
jgi:hypothetical protein